jgi:hypothetical protein
MKPRIKLNNACRANGDKRVHTRYWSESQIERDHCEDKAIGSEIKLKYILDSIKCWEKIKSCTTGGFLRRANSMKVVISDLNI